VGERLTHDLHVLLRHRPRSIYPGGHPRSHAASARPVIQVEARAVRLVPRDRDGECASIVIAERGVTLLKKVGEPVADAEERPIRHRRVVRDQAGSYIVEGGRTCGYRRSHGTNDSSGPRQRRRSDANPSLHLEISFSPSSPCLAWPSKGTRGKRRFPNEAKDSHQIGRAHV